MVERQQTDRAIELSLRDPYEQALRVPNHSAWQRRLTLGMLMFSVAFCALVFHAGWKEIVALEQCAAHELSSCRASAAQRSNAP
jgi:hypothetical protein